MATQQLLNNYPFSQTQNRYNVQTAQNTTYDKSRGTLNSHNQPSPMVKSPEVVAVSITSLIFFFRRICVAFISLPVLLFITPTFIALGFFVLSYLSCGHPFIASFIAAIFTIYIRNQINRFAPTVKKAQEALDQSRILLPVFSIGIFNILCRIFIRIGLINHASETHLDKFIEALGLGIYLGSLGLFLNVLILMRFVGPLAVVKCSNGPLQTNPFDNFLSKISSIDSIEHFLNKMTSPSSVIASFKKNEIIPGFFKRPILLSTALQILFHAMIGYILGSLLPVSGTLISTTMTLMCIMNFINEVLTNGKHEIDTRSFPCIDECDSMLNIIDWLTMETIKSMKNENISNQLILSMLLSLVLDPNKSAWTSYLNFSSLGHFLVSLLFSTFAYFTCTAYLCFSDKLHRLFLSQHLRNTNALFPNLHSMTHESKNAFMTQFLIRTILQNSIVTKRIMFSSLPSSSSHLHHSNNVFSTMQENNFIQTQQDARDMAQFLKASPVIHLAEETLRINTLANLSLPSYSLDAPQEEIMFHFTCMIKALCVYMGGLGDSLFEFYTSANLAEPIERSFHNHDIQPRNDCWLSGGAISQAKYAVHALVRILSGSPTLQKNSCYYSYLHLYVPSMLQSLYSLSKGMQGYGSSKMSMEMGNGNMLVLASSFGVRGLGQDVELNRFISMRLPLLKDVVIACENASLSIIKEERVAEEWRQSRVLSDNCKAWLTSLLE